MATAFLLLNVERKDSQEVLATLRAVGNVKEAYMIYGAYDIIAKVEAENVESLKEVISEKIRKLDRVRSVLTMVTR